jgi:hypothetical protein
MAILYIPQRIINGDMRKGRMRKVDADDGHGDSSTNVRPPPDKIDGRRIGEW